MFENKDLTAMPEKELRKIRGNAISMIFQDPMTSLNPVLRIGEQMTESIELHLKLDRKAAVERAVELVDAVGIPDGRRRLRDYPHQFSGGMRQRIMIAMALSCNPRLLIADEPTTALDVTIQAQILDLLRRLQEERGMAIMLITHNLGVVAEMADDVVVMYLGRVVEQGPVDDIFHKPLHPYTKALLKSIPSIDSTPRVQLPTIPGAPPDLVDPEPGCRFAQRCTRVTEECRQQEPPLVPLGRDDHLVACYRPIVREEHANV
ncbi:MAG: Oligopeptide transport ATP-binding protein OppD [Actinobacteria bacterium ADurb.Bin444]|nr:MAG: Oligopeptide transport ATP-binding protein OppD [Actinobacteria bacterium ADurb.Bin444]